jgi:hypothetical protein
LEAEIHAQHLRKLGAAAQEAHPSLEVELCLMGLDGEVESIA